MDMDLKTFNKQFKVLFDQAKILSKTHPSKVSPYWKELAALCVKFVKSPECPKNLRPKLINQAEIFVQKARLSNPQNIAHSNLENSLKTSNKTKTSNNKSIPFSTLHSKNIPKKNIKLSPNEQKMANILQQLEVPDHIPDDDDFKNKHQTDQEKNKDNYTNKNLDVAKDKDGDIRNEFHEDEKKSNETMLDKSTLDTSSNNNKKLSNEYPSIPIFSTLADLEAELRKMPDNLKEIKPLSTPTPKNDSFKEGASSTLLDATVEKIDSSSIIDSDVASKIIHKAEHQEKPTFKIAGFIDGKTTFDSTSGPTSVSTSSSISGLNFTTALDTNASSDIFGPDGLKEYDNINNNQNKEERLCFACGAKLHRGDNVCPNCGTEN